MGCKCSSHLCFETGHKISYSHIQATTCEMDTNPEACVNTNATARSMMVSCVKMFQL